MSWETEARFFINACIEFMFGKVVSQEALPEWERILRIASKHRILPLISHYILKYHIDQRMHDDRIDLIISDIVILNRIRNQKLLDFSNEIKSSLADKGINIIFRKGLFLEQAVYGNIGLRYFNDIDLFVSSGDRKICQDFLISRGFRFGWFNQVTAHFTSLSREEEIHYQLYADHLPPMVLINNDPLLSVIKLDVCFDISWFTSDFRSSAHTFLHHELSRTSGNDSFNNASVEFHFVDGCLHLFREAYFEANIIDSGTNGVRISKFLDIALMWKKLSYNGERVYKALKSTELDVSGIVRRIAWVAFHVDALFGTDIMGGMNLKLWIEGGFPFTWESRGGEIKRWRGSMNERLFSTDIAHVFYGALGSGLPKSMPED
ncbi:nucleotidyltransferase family protein [Rhizobium sp. VS19-DR104.2]|uniref:nucleotidyltransferase family protein n=1 Tax=unclassified Rhizobium TaxID=2613769 RepID=UPI001CC67706|nr:MULTISPECIES: nucleotidyltransferase family protein [unclassified Rhizobium]MBZ5763728.1 nucleotidyltransferase family protein [Rhizobium sp. VS19-DR96]MBZ5769662.1 nucleotidyltransferase family protein [Rhizobium sp. VS19-DR129.2]MBZ5777195.1 nucleotidyltransferase family protein [Rhizobium sp. VS19-DRK62.2]MBZ5788342.1 nucleotidyltransferase family protein [Rhizobium sp. VS19-DR121]MBZ5805753.1 nucleotidyltransferase family protein [Rhizobium sp. VS19-DR181]